MTLPPFDPNAPLEETPTLISEAKAEINHRVPIPWDHVFMGMAQIIAMRSKDPSTQVGAVLVDGNNTLLAEGFNGPPRELVDTKVPWGVRPEKYAYIIHAEENCILTALDGYGKSGLLGSKLYCTHASCSRCVLRCIRAGVKEILIPSNAPAYPMSDWDCVLAEQVIEAQAFPKLDIRKIPPITLEYTCRSHS